MSFHIGQDIVDGLFRSGSALHFLVGCSIWSFRTNCLLAMHEVLKWSAKGEAFVILDQTICREVVFGCLMNHDGIGYDHDGQRGHMINHDRPKRSKEHALFCWTSLQVNSNLLLSLPNNPAMNASLMH